MIALSNRYSQSWDVLKLLFIYGASCFSAEHRVQTRQACSPDLLYFLSRENSRHLSQVARSFGACMRWRTAIAFVGIAGVCGSAMGVMGIFLPRR